MRRVDEPTAVPSLPGYLSGGYRKFQTEFFEKSGANGSLFPRTRGTGSGMAEHVYRCPINRTGGGKSSGVAARAQAGLVSF